MVGRAWAVFAPTFALVYGALYAMRRPVFIYYPLEGEFALERLSEAHGPGMLWYGWLTAALLAGTAVVALVPARWAARMPPAVSWMSALAAMALIVIDELYGLFA